MKTVTLHLSDAEYRFAQRVSEATGQAIETILQNSIAKALPPLDDVPSEEVENLARLSLLDDAALWREAKQMMTEAEEADMQTLLYRNREGLMTEADQDKLAALLERYGHLTLQKAHAWLLLARRGYRVPPQKQS